MTSVRYDKDGNIILDIQQESKKQLEHIAGFQWNIAEKEVESRIETITTEQSRSAYSSLLNTINPIPEIKKQFKSSNEELVQIRTGALSQCKEASKRFYALLTQPIILRGANKKEKHYNRFTLFATDVLKFGATFTAIFGILFLSLNYQSFWAIAQDNLQPIASVQRQNKLSQSIGSVLAADVSNQAAANSYSAGNPIAHLPPVGPPTNRLIIPKLGLNVPITTPDYTALLQEDWVQLEKDIQESLMDGVVHYPGTAEPGQAGNFFITGHSSYYAWAPGNFKSVFAKLHQLNIGDEYFVYYGGDKHRYRITEKKEVKPNNVDVLNQPLNKRTSTLMTCTPVGTTLRRLILVAQELDPVTGTAIEVGEQAAEVQQRALPAMLPI